MAVAAVAKARTSMAVHQGQKEMGSSAVNLASISLSRVILIRGRHSPSRHFVGQNRLRRTNPYYGAGFIDIPTIKNQ